MKANSTSFRRVTWVTAALMGFIPYLVGIHLYLYREQGSTALALALLVLLLIMTAVAIITAFSHQLLAFCDKIRLVTTARRGHVSVDRRAPSELRLMARHFNTLIDDLENSKQNFREMTAKLMAYAGEIDSYQKKLREEALVRSRLSRYVGANLLEKLIDGRDETPLENTEREVTVLFADIRSFTSLSEGMTPQEVIAMLNEYFDRMVQVIFRQRGMLDKFIGDEMMAVFGVFSPEEEAPCDAVCAAIEMRKVHRQMMDDRNSRGLPVFEAGIGINTGRAVLGNVGAENRADYTVIGDPVNVAARLEQMAQGQEIIIGEETYRCCRQRFLMRERGEIPVKNRKRPVKCYMVMD